MLPLPIHSSSKKEATSTAASPFILPPNGAQKVSEVDHARVTASVNSHSLSSPKSPQQFLGVRVPKRSITTTAEISSEESEIDDNGESHASTYVPNSHSLPAITATPSFFSPSYNLRRIISCDYDPLTGCDTYLLEIRQPSSTPTQQQVDFKRVPPTEILEHVSRGELEIFETQQATRKAKEEKEAAESLKRKILDRRARGVPSETPSSRSGSEHVGMKKPRGRPPKDKSSRLGRPPKARAGSSGYPMVVVPVSPGSMSLQTPKSDVTRQRSSFSMQEIWPDTEIDNADEQEPEWEVEKILDDGIAGDGSGIRVYLVQWVGYEELTWEPLRNLEGSEEAFEEYWRSKKAKRGKKEGRAVTPHEKELDSNRGQRS